jgi:rhomboid family protein
MFPYRDENETQRMPIVTGVIIALNMLAWILVQGAGSSLALAKSVCELGLIPGELTLSLPPGTAFPMGEGIACATDPGRQLSNVITSMFLHGSWMHILGNMWFLWIFGNNIEDSMGHGRFIAFYLICGLAAAMGQVLASPNSPIPMVGASGAISGVMGAYLLLFPRVKVYAIIPLGFIFTSVGMPAWVMLGYWFVIQIISGVVSIGGEGGGVAFWAHAGGFIAGLVLIKLFIRAEYVAAHQRHHWRPRRVLYQ